MQKPKNIVMVKEKMIPATLLNRMLVTETLPLTIREGNQKLFYLTICFIPLNLLVLI